MVWSGGAHTISHSHFLLPSPSSFPTTKCLTSRRGQCRGHPVRHSTFHEFHSVTISRKSGADGAKRVPVIGCCFLCFHASFRFVSCSPKRSIRLLLHNWMSRTMVIPSKQQSPHSSTEVLPAQCRCKCKLPWISTGSASSATCSGTRAVFNLALSPHGFLASIPNSHR